MALLGLLLAAGAAAAQTPALSTAAVAASTVAAAAEAEVTLSAVGDIRLDGWVAGVAREGGDAAPTREVKPLLDADIVFGNLETPITTRGAKTVKTWNFRAKPAYLKIVKAAGFTVLNLANNHVWDYGRDGFLDTLRYVERGGWAYVGAGRDRAAAERVRLFEFDGLTVGVLGLTSTMPEQAWATPRKPGVAYSDFDRIPDIVARAKKECDVLIVSFHGGTELADMPNEIQTTVAHAAISAGADLFLGHHPHVLQPVEVYQGKPILYSLGNFLFVSPSPLAQPTMVVRARLAKGGVRRLDLVPVDVNGGRPRPASPEIAERARAALNRLGELDARPDLLHFGPLGAP